MTRWWEWDGTRAGPLPETESSESEDFRFPLSILCWLLGVAFLFTMLLGLLLGWSTFTTAALLASIGSFVAAWFIWPKRRDSGRA